METGQNWSVCMFFVMILDSMSVHGQGINEPIWYFQHHWFGSLTEFWTHDSKTILVTRYSLNQRFSNFLQLLNLVILWSLSLSWSWWIHSHDQETNLLRKAGRHHEWDTNPTLEQSYDVFKDVWREWPYFRTWTSQQLPKNLESYQEYTGAWKLIFGEPSSAFMSMCTL